MLETKSALDRLRNPVPKYFIYFSLLIAVLMCVARFLYLEDVPRGFYVDEAAALLHSICIRESGIDAWTNNSYPLFFMADTGGIHSPTFVYLNSLWGAIFGFTVGSLRSLAALVSVLGIVAVALLVRYSISAKAGWFALILAAISPWNFQFSRIAWDSYLFPSLSALGLLCFYSSNRFIRVFVSVICLSASVYSYGSARVQIPIILISAMMCGIGNLVRVEKLFVIMLFLLSLIPLALEIVYGNAWIRATYVSIFGEVFRNTYSNSSPLELVDVFFQNFLLHLRPSFLFILGDPINIRHGTQMTGVLSIPEALGVILLPLALLISGKWKTEIRLPLFFLLGFGAGIAPSALTFDSLPHALRSSGSWPFSVALAAYSFNILSERMPTIKHWVLLISGLYGIYFLHTYFFKYPEVSEDWFDYDIQVAAQQLSKDEWENYTTEPWNKSLERYYRYRYNGERCVDTYPVVTAIK